MLQLVKLPWAVGQMPYCDCFVNSISKTITNNQMRQGMRYKVIWTTHRLNSNLLKLNKIKLTSTGEVEGCWLNKSLFTCIYSLKDVCNCGLRPPFPPGEGVLTHCCLGFTERLRFKSLVESRCPQDLWIWLTLTPVIHTDDPEVIFIIRSRLKGRWHARGYKLLKTVLS